MGVMKKQDIDFLYFMKGVMDSYDTLSDGAWWAVGQETVEFYNKEFGKNIDPYEGFQHYIENVGSL